MQSSMFQAQLLTFVDDYCSFFTIFFFDMSFIYNDKDDFSGELVFS